jgi:transcriptional regulator with XRE-family HTH domain
MGRYQRKTTRIPLEPLQEAFKESGLSLSEVCYRMGWMKRSAGRTLADTSRLQRALGLRVESNSRTGNLHAHIGIDRALRIAEALDLDPSVVDEWLPEPEPEAPAAADGRCPECGTTATWTDSWDQQRCDQCWAIVATAEAAA